MNKNNWDEEITPKKNLLDINLKAIWDYKDLMSLFVRRDFVSIYKQTVFFHWDQESLYKFL